MFERPCHSDADQIAGEYAGHLQTQKRRSSHAATYPSEHEHAARARGGSSSLRPSVSLDETTWHFGIPRAGLWIRRRGASIARLGDVEPKPSTSNRSGAALFHDLPLIRASMLLRR